MVCSGTTPASQTPPLRHRGRSRAGAEQLWERTDDQVMSSDNIRMALPQDLSGPRGEVRHLIFDLLWGQVRVGVQVVALPKVTLSSDDVGEFRPCWSPEEGRTPAGVVARRRLRDGSATPPQAGARSRRRRRSRACRAANRSDPRNRR